jgi:hypothetical protein
LRKRPTETPERRHAQLQGPRDNGVCQSEQAIVGIA